MVCARYLPTYRKRHAMTLSRSITHTTNCSLTLTLIRSLQIRTHHCGDDLKATKQDITCTYEHMYTCTMYSVHMLISSCLGITFFLSGPLLDMFYYCMPFARYIMIQLYTSTQNKK